MTTGTNTDFGILSVAKEAQSDKKVLEKPPPAPARWRETYDVIKETRLRFPAPVNPMGRNMVKRKEMDPRVRDPFIMSLSLN